MQSAIYILYMMYNNSYKYHVENNYFTLDSCRSRGFGFVTFDDISSVDALLEEQKRQPLMMRGKKVVFYMLNLLNLIFALLD